MPHTPPETRAEAPDAGLSRDAYALLAQANLLRIRGRWDEAVARCMAVLQAAPDNASAHSLLGDIYENQGRIDEAIQWYRMALDQHPDSPADALKLNRLLQRKAQIQPPVVAAPPARTRHFPVAPERALRLGAYTAASLILLLVLSAPVITQRRAAHAPAAPADKTISTPPVVVPPVTAQVPDAGAEGTVSPPADPGEQAVFQTLRAAPEMAGPGTTLVDAQYDPRAARLSLTLLCRPTDATPASRRLVLRDALAALQAAARLTADQGVTAFTVRCLLGPAGPDTADGTPLVFVGDTTRAALPGDGIALDALSPAQLQAPFTQPWWSPTLAS